MSRQETVGVVGLGAMGLPIARALATQHPVVAHDASPEAASRMSWLVEEGRQGPSRDLRLVDLPTLARSANTVVLSLSSAAAVSEVVREICPLAPGLLVLDTRTIGPDDSRRIHEEALALGSTYLDAPVLGRPSAVGGWTIPLGGPVSAVDAVTRLLTPLGRVVHVGEVGQAATLKVVNNLMFSVINAATAEALALASAAGLSPALFVETVLGSSAATVSGLFRSVAPKAVAGDFDPVFSLDLVRKDNGLAVALAESYGLTLEVGGAALALHERAVAAGLGSEDSIAVLKLLDPHAG